MADDFAGSFGSFLDGTNQRTQPKDEGFGASFGSFVDDIQEIGRRNAKLNLFGARDVKPDDAAKAQGLARETGLPPETVERNMPDVEQQVRAARQDKILRESPALVQWLQDGANARIAHDDFEKLGFFEKTWQTMSRGWTDAQLGNERGRLGYASMVTGGAPEYDKRLGELDTALRKPQGGEDDLFQRAVRATSGLLGGFVDQLTSEPVLASTALGTAIGAVGGGGVGDVVTVPAGATAGFIGGLVADGFRIGAGQTWLSLKAMRDSEGHPIDHNVAVGASIVGGLLMGALNAVGVKQAGRPIVEGGQALIRQAVEDAVAVPTARAALGQLGLGIAKSTAVGAGFGALNEGTMIAVEQAARLVSDGNFGTVLDDPAEQKAAADRLVQSIVDMAMGFGVLGTAGHGAGFVGGLARARQATRDAAFLERLNGAAADSATRERAPDAFARFVEQQANGSPVETLYIPAAKVRELYQRVGLDPFEITDDDDPVFGFLPDRRQQLEQGLATGGDVAVPLAQYISKLAGSDLHNALKDDIRVRPDGMTLREAREFEKHYAAALAERGEEVRAGAAAAAEKAAPAMAVFDDAVLKLRAAGFTLDTARQYAALVSARYATRATRMGTDALSEYQRAGIEFQQILPERLRQYTPDQLDMMLTEMKSGRRAMTESKLLGPTLLEWLSTKGLTDVDGDLAAMDIDQWHREKPFRAKLVRAGGRDLDDAALSAFEAGYFPELIGRVDRPDIQHLKDAISEELSGKPRRPDYGSNRDAADVERMRAMDDLDRLLNLAGVDLKKVTVKQARAALDRYEREARDGYEQNRTVQPAKGEPIADVKGDELGPAGEVTPEQLKEMRAKAREVWQADYAGKSAVNKDLGEIKFTNSGRGKFFSNTSDPDKLRLVPILRQIVEKADLVETLPNPIADQPVIRALHWLEADVAIDGKARRVGFSVREDNNGNLFYNLNATPEETSSRNAESAPAAPSIKSGVDALPGGKPKGPLHQSKVGSEPDHVNLALDGQARSYDQAVYHGSPHIFDRFTLDHIGTGEGAQAYGWGLYFAGNKEVARYYREILTRGGPERAILLRGEPVKPDNGYLLPGLREIMAYLDMGQSFDAAKAQVEDRYRLRREKGLSDPRHVKELDEALKVLDGLKEGDLTLEQRGRLYHVEIPDDGAYLRWDERLGAQTPDVEAKTAALAERYGFKDELSASSTGRDFYEKLAEALTPPPPEDPPGTPRGWGFVQRGSAGHKEASLALREAGVPGIQYLDGASRRRGEGHHNYVLFDDALATIKQFEQPGEGKARGSVRFEDGRTIISLFEQRDLSTVIHEMGHTFLEELGIDAQRPEAPQQVRDDAAATLRWFGVKDFSEVTVEHHEQWARAFEAYALEGKAPSAELGGVFQRFKAWLVSIYKAVEALRTPINDEIRGVFDRLIATDDEIAAAREQVGELQHFASAEQAGMTDAEFRAYIGAVEKARSTAETELLKKVMRDVRRRREATWQAEEAKVREEVTREVDRRADIASLQYLRKGQIEDHVDGVDVAGLKLSRDALVDMYGGPGVLAMMPRGVPPIVVERGGVHPDVIAEMLGGFRSGRDMIDALLSLEDQQRQLRERGEKRSIRSWMIDDETNRRMVDRHGDMLNDGSIQEEALAVLHSEDALAVHAVEMRALARRAGKEREATPLDIVRKWAADAIADKTVKAATVLGNYQRAERAAAHAVESALLAGDHAEAFRQKQAQMMNAALYSEARKAKEEVDSGQRMLDRYAAARTLSGMDQDYLEQIHGLLERFDFRPATNKEVQRRASFAEWALEQQAKGVDVVAPSSLMADAFHTHYTNMTMAEFRGLVDSVKQIAHLGRLKKELTVNAEKREFEAVVEETVDRLSQLPQRVTSDDINPGRGRGLPAVAVVTGRWARRLNAALLKMETVFEWLDSEQVDGPFNRVVWEPIAKAQHERNDLLKEYTAKLVELRKGLDAKTQARMLEKVATPELLNKETLRPYSMRLEEVVAIALNWGNQGNRDKLLKGYGWSDGAVEAVLARHMTADLWKFVQGSWDLIETLWPRIAEMERRVNGVAPEKVERVEVDTPHGRFAGGYYPVVYDPLKSFDAAERAAASSDLFENIYTRATTPKGFTKERQETYARPIFLSLDVIPRHVAEVIHDFTHREAIMQADKFLSNREVLKAVEGALGREYTEQFRPWLQSIANEYAQDRRELAAWDQVSKSTRMRATMVGLGFRLTTMMAQPVGLFDAAEAIGARWVTAGLAEAYGSPARWKAARDFVFERSGEMRNRMGETDRDIRDAMRGLLGQTGWVADARRFAYYGIAMLDMGVALPTWLGAYRKALHEGSKEADAVVLADRAVRDSQGAGGAKDLAAVQRGPEFMKLATMFYSYFSHFYQRQATLVRDARNIESAGDVPHLLARSFFLMVAPALLSAIVTGQGPKEDEDWGPWAARKVGLGLFNGVPLVRDAANMVENDLGGGYARGYQFTPVARVIDTLWKTAKDAGNAVSGGDVSERWVQHALETSGYIFGLPLGQGGQTGQFLYNVWNGDEQPDGVGEWLKGLTFGKSAGK